MYPDARVRSQEEWENLITDMMKVTTKHNRMHSHNGEGGGELTVMGTVSTDKDPQAECTARQGWVQVLRHAVRRRQSSQRKRHSRHGATSREEPPLQLSDCIASLPARTLPRRALLHHLLVLLWPVRVAPVLQASSPSITAAPSLGFLPRREQHQHSSTRGRTAC